MILEEREAQLYKHRQEHPSDWEACMEELEWINRERGRIWHFYVDRQEHSREHFLRSRGYIIRDPGGCISSQELYSQYLLWCADRKITPYSIRGLNLVLKQNRHQYGVIPVQNIPSPRGTHVRGYRGIRVWQDADGPRIRVDEEALPGTFVPTPREKSPVSLYEERLYAEWTHNRRRNTE